MANISNYLEEAILDHVFNDVEYTASTNLYLALFSESATETEMEEGTLTNEITDYTGDRPEITFTSASQSEEGKAEIENEAQIEFDDMPAVDLQYGAVMDADSDGNILYWLVLSEGGTVPVAEGDVVRVDAGAVTIDLD